MHQHFIFWFFSTRSLRTNTRPLAFVLTVIIGFGWMAPGKAQNSRLEEIIVSAQKRDQNLQDVGLSLDVLQGHELALAQASAQDILFLAARSPSLYAESSSGRTFPRFYIRGLGNTDFDLNASQPVSLVYDGIVLENSILKGFPVFDVERIEVLRGPQGTLFGRNTPAGVVKFESVRPSQEAGGYFRGAFGRFDTWDLEGAYGGSLNDRVSVRASGLYQQRDDFVDNVFAGGEAGFEEFEEFAGRFQLEYIAGDSTSTLFNVHARKLNGGSRLFRANIIRPGTNDLVPDFDRFRTGQDATQILDVDNFGASFTLEHSFGSAALTSITGFESVEAKARGDVDGGFGADFLPPAGRGSIPFAAESADNINDHAQWTHETRLDFISGENVTSTLGVFLFYENLEIENLSFDTLGGGTLNGRAEQDQETQSVAIFYSSDWQVTERTSLTGGLRLSSEDRDFLARRVLGPFGAPPLGPETRKLNDTVLSGDLGAMHVINNEISLYARYARSFRAPSVQGRIVFADAITVADTETIDSFEVGLKSELWQNRLRLNGTAYYFETSDQQLTAVGGAGNFNQLLNADSVIGQGIELDANLMLGERFELNAGYSYNDTEIKDTTLEVAACAVGCTLLDPVNPATGNALIDGNRLPQAPEHIANLVVRYGVSLPALNGELYISGDVAYRSDISFFLYESAEFQGNSLTETGLRLGFIRNDGRFELAWFYRNITDELELEGAIDFNNFTGFVSDPRSWGVELMSRF